MCEARYQIHNERIYGPELFLTKLAQDGWEAEKRFFSGGVFRKDTHHLTQLQLCIKFTENTLLDANRKRPKPNNKNQQQATTKNRLNCSEGADRNWETEFFALFWKKLPYFSFWNLSSGFLEVVGVSSITSDPSLMLKNLSLRWDEMRWDLASRNTGSKKDQAFDLHCKGWILQTALQGLPKTSFHWFLLLSVLFTRIKFYFLLFPFSLQRRMLLFKDWKNQRVFCLSITLLFQWNALLQ